MPMNIKVIEDLSKVDVSKLVEESEAEGYRFLRRLVNQYEDGTNTFNKAGEVLYGVWDPAGELVAIGGLNRDPYSDKSGIGRLRRFYISEHARRQGIGTKLLKEILNYGQGHFSEIVVRTDSSNADAFYRANGFSGDLGMPDVTHSIVLDNEYSKEAK
ncbi:GNAT family N-acetyltransferase [Planococcus halotolerans]|uniref:GNAT family N-acetyltransferase n=1 Tax=Planococcus halotolerans TaxID=2233542 RepID=A0A365KR95_9BACL|nr:GNAT family N-acetyltransferase [Planococcus halotolerans]QHJ69382.1 GNAT family N-acetyltransferase [Planococcus halotolerans]RAZ75636.1 GNAT family N-acetyltransferase [Planococcus halotolerans]